MVKYIKLKIYTNSSLPNCNVHGEKGAGWEAGLTIFSDVGGALFQYGWHYAITSFLDAVRVMMPVTDSGCR